MFFKFGLSECIFKIIFYRYTLKVFYGTQGSMVVYYTMLCPVMLKSLLKLFLCNDKKRNRDASVIDLFGHMAKNKTIAPITLIEAIDLSSVPSGAIPTILQTSTHASNSKVYRLRPIGGFEVNHFHKIK